MWIRGVTSYKSLGNFYKVIGYDIDRNRIAELKKNKNSNEIKKNFFKRNKNIIFTSKFEDIKKTNVFIITLPTPLNSKNLPYLDDIINLSEEISKILKKGTW